MASNLNSVETKLTIAGKSCHFVHLTLDQAFNSHHRFVIRVDYQEFSEKWMDSPAKIIQLIGEDVGITMQHKETGETYNFKGIVTDVSMAGQHGEQNYYVICGYSPTIKLEDHPTMDCFIDSTLKNIVTEAVGTSGNGGEVTSNPKFKETIDYICQYNESAFQFLNRLSWKYGEWNFYDGITHYFGKPDGGNTFDIYYDKEMTRFDLRAVTVQPTYTRHYYISPDDSPISKSAPDFVNGIRGYIKASVDASKKILGKGNPVLPLEPMIGTMKDLEDMVKVEKYRAVASSLIMQGDTQSCKVQIGKLINVILPPTMDVPVKDVETFLVTEVRHEADQDGTYKNTFKGIPSEMENIPMPPIQAPVAYPQIAWVKSNADPKNQGRIQVQTQWQKILNKNTNWIRVQTLDAGSSPIFPKNRGHVFIPEVGDQVLIDFEYGDPDRPYCSGSLFTSQTGVGGGVDNNIKSIKTRSGHTVEFNDTKNAETIKIRDVNANEILYDTRSKTITISTLEQINLVSKTVRIDASEDFIVSVGRDMQQSVGNNFTHVTSGESRISVGKSSVTNVENDYEVVANRNIEIESGKNTAMIVGGKLREDVESNIDITSIGGKTNISSKGKIEIKSNDKVHIK